MTLPAYLLDALSARDKNYSLPREFYNSDAIYQMDLETIWYQSWLFIGHTCELNQSDASIDFQLADLSISVYRTGKDYAAKVTEGQPHQIHCQAVSGYLFISLAKVPEPFSTFAETISPYTTPHNVADLKVVAESHIIEYGNWKLVIENNRECYHCLGNHPELIITYPEDPAVTGTDANSELPQMVSDHWKKCESVGLASQFKISDDGTYRVARMPLLEDFTSYTMDGYDAVKKHVGDFNGVNPGALVLFHYPSTWNHFLDDHVISFRLLPIGPQATLVTTKWLVHQEAIEGVDYDLKKLTHVWNQTNLQDKKLVEENQSGINSPAYEPGPYSSVYESGVIQFIEWYSQLLQRRLNKKAA